MLIARYKKIQGKWTPIDLNEEKRKKAYLRSLPDGSEVVVTYEVEKALKTLKQLRIIHAYINEICIETGQDSKSIKDLIKEKANLKNKDGSYKSFKDCTKTEMSTAIMSTIEVANFLNINLDLHSQDSE